MRIIEIAPPYKITTAYHITTVPDAANIIHHGLTPHNGKIFLIPDIGNTKKLKDELGLVARWMYAKTEDTDDALTLLRIDVSDIDLQYYDGWYISLTPIEPSRIRDLGDAVLSKYA